MEMIDRVAKAMQASKAWPVVFDAGSAEALARAAIEAMRPEIEACAAYFNGYCQDEADDVDNCVCGMQQHQAARAFCRAVVALSPSLKEQDRAP